MLVQPLGLQLVCRSSWPSFQAKQPAALGVDMNQSVPDAKKFFSSSFLTSAYFSQSVSSPT